VQTGKKIRAYRRYI